MLKVLLLFLTSFVEVICLLELFGTFFEPRDFFKSSRFVAFPLVVLFATIITCVNLLGYITLNVLVTMVCIYLAGLCVYKVKFGPSILYLLITVGVFIFIEYTTMVLFKFEERFYLHGNMTEYAVVVENPVRTIVMTLLTYIPFFVIKQCFKKKKVKFSTSTFLLYIAIPLCNISSIFFLPLLGIDIGKSEVVRIGYLLFMVSSIISSFLIFFAFQRHTEEIQKTRELAVKNLTTQHEKDLLEVSSGALKERLSNVENFMENERILRHDRRHFENTIYSLLKEGDSDSIEQAKKLLEEKINAEPKRLRKWVDNDTVNATIEYYASMAEKENIKIESSLNIPKNIRVDSLQLSIALGNLLENAINANLLLPEEERFLKFKSVCKKQLLIQIENPCSAETKLSEDGYPFTKDLNHGVGTKSVLAFAGQTQSEVLYSIENNVFCVKMII